jgi:plastocyanin domain-containing protein
MKHRSTFTALVALLALHSAHALAAGKAKDDKSKAASTTATATTSPTSKTATATPAPAPRHIKVGVTEAGFEPKEIEVKPNETVVLDIMRVTEETCATAIVVPDQKVKQDLPMNQEVQVTLHAGPNGRVAFACPMNMITGALVVKE